MDLLEKNPSVEFDCWMAKLLESILQFKFTRLALLALANMADWHVSSFSEATAAL